MTTPSCVINAEVRQAIAEIEGSFPNTRVTAEEDGSGGAHVFLNSVPLADFYAQGDTWVGFHITNGYPFADVYPHFVRPDLQYANGKQLARQGLSSGHTFRGRSAVQISRRSNRRDASTDTAALKLLKVVEWLNRPTP